MQPFLFYWAVAPPLFLIYLVYLFDRGSQKQRNISLMVFILGSLTVLPSFIAENVIGYFYSISEPVPFGMSNIGIFFYVLIGIALVEEFFKFLVIKKYAYHQDEFKAPYDGILYAVITSLGFALIENIIYVFVYNETTPLQTAIGRMFSAIPAHALMGVFMGYYIGKAKFDKVDRQQFLLKGLFSAVALHTLYDYFLLLPMPRLDYSMYTLIIASFIAVSLIKKSRNQSIIPTNSSSVTSRDNLKSDKHYRQPKAAMNISNKDSCHTCGTNLMPTMKFCYKCGVEISKR